MNKDKFNKVVMQFLKAAKHRDSLLDPLVKAKQNVARAKMVVVINPSTVAVETLDKAVAEKEKLSTAWTKEIVAVAAMSYYVSAYMAVTLMINKELPDATLEMACNEVLEDIERIMEGFLEAPDSILEVNLETCNPTIIDLGNIFMPHLTKLIDEQHLTV